MTSVRPAVDSDIETLYFLDHIARLEQKRREFIKDSVTAGTCYVAVSDEALTGYVVLNYSFYQQGFIDMLYVKPEYRRSGAGTALLVEMEKLCRTQKIFTSTNLSNLPMQALLNRQGYALSGVINNLDEGDPELVYYKQLR